MALAPPVDRKGPSGYVPFPTCIIDQRTGQPSLAVELLSLEGTVRIADFRQVCGSPGWRRETLLGGTERPGWALESDQCFVIKVSARCNFREIGAANSLSAIWARWTRSGAGECTGYLWEWLLAPPSPIPRLPRNFVPSRGWRRQFLPVSSASQGRCTTGGSKERFRAMSAFSICSTC